MEKWRYSRWEELGNHCLSWIFIGVAFNKLQKKNKKFQGLTYIFPQLYTTTGNYTKMLETLQTTTKAKKINFVKALFAKHSESRDSLL